MFYTKILHSKQENTLLMEQLSNNKISYSSLHYSSSAVSSFPPLIRKIQPFHHFLSRLLGTRPPCFPDPPFQVQMKSLRGMAEKIYHPLTWNPILNTNRAFRSCLSGALTCLYGCLLSLGRSAQGAAFLTHPRSRYPSNLQQV